MKRTALWLLLSCLAAGASAPRNPHSLDGSCPSRVYAFRSRFSHVVEAPVMRTLGMSQDGSGTASTVVYRGEPFDPRQLSALPRPYSLADQYRWFWNPSQRTVLVVSLLGVGHHLLSKIVPPDAQLLGGTRYQFLPGGAFERGNSTALAHLNGPAAEAWSFNVRFTPPSF